MGFLEDSVIVAKGWIDAAGKKGGELAEAQKIKMTIAKFRSQLTQDYQTLGRLAYDAAKNGTDTDEVYAAIVLSIDEKLEKVVKMCGECGHQNPPASDYCCRCGKKLRCHAYDPTTENCEESAD